MNITTHTENNITIITINRESKLNALTIDTLREIKEAVTIANADDSVYGMIITGAGQKAFAAGADISEFAHFNEEQATRMSADGHDVMNTIEDGNKICIAAVNGFALGGGCELAMACHLRIASGNAKVEPNPESVELVETIYQKINTTNASDVKEILERSTAGRPDRYK